MRTTSLGLQMEPAGLGWAAATTAATTVAHRGSGNDNTGTVTGDAPAIRAGAGGNTVVMRARGQHDHADAVEPVTRVCLARLVIEPGAGLQDQSLFGKRLRGVRR